jgi:hypothetical protein
MVVIQPELKKELIEKARKNVFHKLGYHKKKMDPEVEKILKDAFLLVEEHKVIKPKGIYHILPVLKAVEGEVETDAGVIKSQKFSLMVKMCHGKRRIVFMLATIGDEFEKIYHKKKPLSSQFVFDTVGSELTETVADILERDWKVRIDNEGLQSSLRFSPGYCDWDLDGQSIIFNALDGMSIGVSFNNHFVMRPCKSISAIAVIARSVPIKAPCSFCIEKDCRWRRAL